MVRSRRTALALLLATLSMPVMARPAATQTSSVTLSWSAPGDDGLVGTATRYDLRYSQRPIVETTFALAASWPSMPLPGAPGARQSVTITGLQTSAVYYFAIKTADERGNWSPISNVIALTGGGQPVDANEVEGVLALSPPLPNPARDVTRLVYDLPRPAHVWLEVLDVLGRRVRTLVDAFEPAGRREYAWNLSDDRSRPLPAGVYLVRARILGEVFLRRLAIVR